MLHGVDGFKILAHLRSQNKQDGVIIIYAENTLKDKIKGLNIGSDDYLAKPFAFQAFFYFHYRETTNSGLGLAIVKEICIQNGYEIRYRFENSFHNFRLPSRNSNCLLNLFLLLNTDFY